MTTQFLPRDGGSIAYDVHGDDVRDDRPLIVLVPGMADTRAAYRHLAPLLVEAGYRVATSDLRGHGESSVGWASYTRADTADDIAALITHLGGPAVVVGQSFSGGSATIVAARHPELVNAIVEIGPFTRAPKFDAKAFLHNDHGYRSGALALARFAITGKPAAWLRYLGIAYPGSKPADWDAWSAALTQNLAEDGRVTAARAMIQAKPTDAAAALGDVRCPALVVMGSLDSDFADPRGEADGIVAALPTGLGEVAMIEGAGHYPHAQMPQQVGDAILGFLARLS